MIYNKNNNNDNKNDRRRWLYSPTVEKRRVTKHSRKYYFRINQTQKHYYQTPPPPPSSSSYCLRKQSPTGKKSQHRCWYMFHTYVSCPVYSVSGLLIRCIRKNLQTSWHGDKRIFVVSNGRKNALFMRSCHILFGIGGLSKVWGKPVIIGCKGKNFIWSDLVIHHTAVEGWCNGRVVGGYW